ncbi:hypothetical protein BKC07_14615 [Peribacillus simplex]|nr:hypothetical protein BKC07_14615 [Peribacillus simplex]
MAGSRRKGSGFLESAGMFSRTNCRLISHRIMFETSLSFKFFTCNPHWMKENCDTPAEILSSRDPTGAYAEEAWQTVGGKGADF